MTFSMLIFYNIFYSNLESFTKQNKSSASLEKTQIKFQVKEAYVMKGGRKEFKNVLILCETRDGKIEIGWSNRAEDSPFRRHSM